MNIQFDKPTSPKPTSEELKIKSPTYSKSKEERREICGEIIHDNYIRNVSEKIELDNKRSQENVDRARKEMDLERKEKGYELDQDLERGSEQHDKHLFDIAEKGRKDVDHAKQVHDKVMKSRTNSNHIPQQ